MSETMRWAQLETLLDEWKVKYELVDAVDLADVKSVDYSQVRAEDHRAPKANVETYALQMSNGAEFPPIVLAANDKAVIDGNTRIAAARRNGMESFPAYLVHPADVKMTRAIGAALNMMGGERLDGSELESAARDFLDAGFMDAEIARRLGRTAEWARRFRKRTQYQERAQGHPGSTKLAGSAAERLADIRLDAPLTTILDAANDGLKIDAAWAKKLAEAAESERSEARAVEAVKTVLDEMRPTQQAPDGRRPTVKANRTMLTAMKRVDNLTAVLAGLDVPLVDPLASQYRDSLVALRVAVDGVLDRLPAATAEADAA